MSRTRGLSTEWRISRGVNNACWGVSMHCQERAARADLAVFDRLLARAGVEPPRPGDEIDDTTQRTLRIRTPSSRPKRSVRPSAKRTA